MVNLNSTCACIEEMCLNLRVFICNNARMILIRLRNTPLGHKYIYTIVSFVFLRLKHVHLLNLSMLYCVQKSTLNLN